LGAEGVLLGLKVADGGVVWHVNLNEGKTPIWGYAGHPLIEGEVLYTLCTGKNMVRAMDKHTGKTIWSALVAGKDGPGYCPPTMAGSGANRQLIIWNPEALHSLDPKTGAVNWTQPFGPVQNGVSIATPAVKGDKLMISSSWDGALVMQLDADRPGAKVLWKRGGKPGSKKTDALHALMSNILLGEDHIYGVCARGELRCLDAKTGERMWETLAATTAKGEPQNWATAFVIPNGDRVFITNELGDLIVAKISSKGYEEVSRAHLLEPVNKDAGRPVVWSCPAYANKSMYWRNDKELICVSLAK
jgi:outer membrane protein assembly factor BamB